MSYIKYRAFLLENGKKFLKIKKGPKHEDLWINKRVKLRRKFPDSWQEDFYQSQLRFLPDPPADPDWIGRDPHIFRESREYWTVLYVSRGKWLDRLRRHQYAVPLWISEKDHHCYALPSIMLDNV